MNRKSSSQSSLNQPSLDQQLQSLRQEVQEKEQRLLFLSAEIQSRSAESDALKHRWQRQKDELAAQSKRQLEQGQQELEQILAPLRQEADHTRGTIKTYQLLITDLDNQKQQLTSELASLVIKIAGAKQDLASCLGEVEAKQADLIQLKRADTEFKAAQSLAEQKLADLDGARADLEDDIANLEDVRLQIAGEIQDSKAAFKTQQLAQQQELAELESRLKDLKWAARTEQVQIESERKIIASRILAADERDRVLKVRERKVNDAEDHIQQNSSYLDL